MNQQTGPGVQRGGGGPGAPGGRPGQMTMAMRAMPQVSGPKVLRIGKVQGGRVIEERVIKQRTHVTIGSSHTNMFLASGAGGAGAVPETMRLFELVGNDYVLNITDAMTGRVALPSGVTDVAQARASGMARKTGQFYQLKLTEDSRGKVAIGDTTFLFQFVAPPPIQPKPQLPLAVKGGLASQIDWRFTIIAAFSFLLHFGLAGAVNSDWFDPLIDEDAETAALIQSAKDRPAPPIEEKKEEKEDPNAKKEPDKKGPEPDKKAPGKAGPAGPKPGSMAAQGKALSSELDQLELKALGSLGGQGPAQSSIMKPGATAADSSLDNVASKAGGVDTGGAGLKTGAGGGGPLMPGAGGKGLSGIGDTKGGGGGGGGGGQDKSAEVKAPTGDANVGAVGGQAGNVKDVDSVIARNRWRFKACYNKALATDPTAGGTVKVAVKIGEGGEVVSASSVSSDAPTGLTQCIVSSFQAMKFSPPEGGTAGFTAPVVLSSKK